MNVHTTIFFFFFYSAFHRLGSVMCVNVNVYEYK
jgi:hypothetical protein